MIGGARAVWALFASDRARERLAALGALAIAVGAFDAAIFVWHLGARAPAPLLVPAAQKVAALLVSAWIAAVALFVLLDKDSRERMSDTFRLHQRGLAVADSCGSIASCARPAF